jgi:hypothetical protein
MKRAGTKILIITTATLFIMAAMTTTLWADPSQEKDQAKAPAGDPGTAAAAKDSPDSRLNRIDFGNTYIIGQSIKSGAVYLLQRKKSEIKSMLKYREDYRDEILEGFLPEAGKDTSGKQEGTLTAKSDQQGSQSRENRE